MNVRAVIPPLLVTLAIAGQLCAQALPRVRIATPRGEIDVELDTVRAPITTANFLRYVDGRFFHGGRFIRTVRADNQSNDSVKIGVIQAAIDSARSREQFLPVPLERTSATGLLHRDGTISMARAGPAPGVRIARRVRRNVADPRARQRRAPTQPPRGTCDESLDSAAAAAAAHHAPRPRDGGASEL